VTKVRCEVESCEFWGDGKVCTADEIRVKNNTVGVVSPMSSVLEEDTEVASEIIGATDETPAKTSRQTKCETMRLR